MEGASRQLTELLRRAHKSELEPLAEILHISHPHLGFGKLVDTIDSRVRQAGGNEIANVMRRGQGPEYPEMLAGLLRRQGLKATGSVVSDEEALLVWSFREVWRSLGHEERELVWSRLGAEGRAPDDPGSATELARAAVGASFVFRIAGLAARPKSISRIFNPLLGPLALPAAVFSLARPKDHRVLPAVLEIARLRQVVEKRVTVGIVGSPSTGKDAAISALFGVETGNISPIAGSTSDVQITQLPGATALYVVNTPGLGDVVESVTEEALQILAHVDVFVYLVNAQGGVQQRERDDHARCVATGRPVLVVLNKVDTLREADRARLVEDTQTKLGVDRVLPVAFDPLPQLSDAPLGMDEVRDWLRAELIRAGKVPEELDGIFS